jgi:hypothetical protein
MSLDTNQEGGLFARGFTFTQTNTPTVNIKIGDTWMNPNTGLSKVYNRNKTWRQIDLNSLNGPGSEFGYVCGGDIGGLFLSSIERIAFPFDSGTASLVGNLSGSRFGFVGCNSSNYGYTMGGNNGSSTSTIDRITFPFDSGTASKVGNLSGTRYAPAGCNSSNYGYSMGGYNGSAYISSIDRITFPFDSGTASKVGNLSGTRYAPAGCNSSNYGYSMGGYISSSASIIDRIIFPFDSGTASYVGNLSGTRYHVSGCNSSNYGYCMGGYDNGVAVNMSTINRIAFPFDSGTSSQVGNLSGNRRGGGGCNSSNYGYSMGGYVAASVSTIDRIMFPFDSGTASYVGNLSGIKYIPAAIDCTDFVTLFN